MVSRNTILSKTMKMRHFVETLDTPQVKHALSRGSGSKSSKNYEFKKGDTLKPSTFLHPFSDNLSDGGKYKDDICLIITMQDKVKSWDGGNEQLRQYYMNGRSQMQGGKKVDFAERV